MTSRRHVLAPLLLAIRYSPFAFLLSPALAIEGGHVSQDAEGVRRATVAILAPTGKCTGTVIARRLVVTAAHCLREEGDYTVRLVGPDFAPQDVAVEAVMRHPNHRTPGREGRYLHGAPQNDVGLVLAAEDFPEWIVPATITGRDPFQGKHPEKFLIAGFGPPGPSEEARVFGTLRELAFGGVARGPGRNLTLDLGKGAACIGDSGGPVFLRGASSIWLIGVMNAVAGPRDMVCGRRVVMTPLPAARAFIEDEARKVGQRVIFEESE